MGTNTPSSQKKTKKIIIMSTKKNTVKMSCKMKQTQKNSFKKISIV